MVLFNLCKQIDIYLMLNHPQKSQNISPIRKKSDTTQKMSNFIGSAIEWYNFVGIRHEKCTIITHNLNIR